MDDKSNLNHRGWGGGGLGQLSQPATRGKRTRHKMTLNQPPDLEKTRNTFLFRKSHFTHRVDVSFNQIVFLRLQDQVVSSEGDDSRLPAAPGNLREAVGVQAPTRQDVTAPHPVALLIQAEQITSLNISKRMYFYKFLPFCL